MGVYKYDATNDELIPIAGVPSVPGIEDKVSTYTADATYWDTSPTSASNKPVTSGGVYTALSNKADASALSDKLNTYASDSTQWDVTPTAASNNPVTSSGISAALSGKAPITHTSSTPDTYGAGTTSLYGHNKIVDGLTKTSVASGESLSAHMGNCIGNMIAPVQANLIAIQKYEIGEQFIYDGVLYTATALISKDGTITINGNCSKASDIVSQISNLATLEKITTATGVQFAYRMGRICFFTFEVTLTNATAGTVICSGLPRPQGVVYCSFMTITGLAVPCILEADGALKIYYPNTLISGRVDGSLMYFIYE